MSDALPALVQREFVTLMKLVMEQADDAALWAEEAPLGEPTVTASEAYVRARLRELHAAVEQFVESATGGAYTASCVVCERRTLSTLPPTRKCFGCMVRQSCP